MFNFNPTRGTVAQQTRKPRAERMQRASYRMGVEWIALNDEPADMEHDTVSALISTALLADLFGVTPSRVADDILRYRTKHAKGQA